VYAVQCRLLGPSRVKATRSRGRARRSGKERRGETERERPAVKYIRAAVRLRGAATNHADPRCYPPHGVGVVPLCPLYTQCAPFPEASMGNDSRADRERGGFTQRRAHFESSNGNQLHARVKPFDTAIYVKHISYNLRFVNHLQNLIIILE